MPTTTEKEGPALSDFIAIRTKQIDFILLSIKNDWEMLLMDVISSQYVITPIKIEVLIFLLFAEIEN